MTPFVRGLAPVVCVALLVTHAARSCAAPPGWMSDYRKAFELSRKQGKPILADFSTDWCPNCRKLEQDTFKNPAVSGRLEQFIKLYIDGDRYPEMVERFGIEGYPTLVAISPQGKELDRSVGYVNARRLAGTLDRAIQLSPPVPAGKPGESKTETAVADANAARAGNADRARNDGVGESAVRDTGRQRPESGKTVVQPAVVSKLPDGANFYTIVANREPRLHVTAAAPRREFQVAQVTIGADSATATDASAGAAEHPRPLINVGRTREAATESPAAPAVSSQPKTATKPPVEPRAPKQAEMPQSVAAPAPPAVSGDPLATVRLLQATSGAARAETPQEPAAAAATPQAARKVGKPAVTEKQATSEPRATPKPATAVAPKPDMIPATEMARPASRDTAAAAPTAARAATPPSREDAERWMKDGDEKLRDGRKKEAKAQYAKIVEMDPSNETGYADVAFIKMVSLMVDRDDAALRQEAHAKVSEFLARYPNSPHKDYYTVIRAMLAIDLDKTDEAAALLQDFPTEFPNSRFTEMAYKLWTGLPETKRARPQTPRRQ